MADGSEFGAAVLLVVCGLPGAGKTTLCCRLKEYLSESEESVAHVLHICYDELIPSDLGREAIAENSLRNPTSRSSITESESNISSWKSYRRLIVDSVEKLVSFRQYIEEKDRLSEKETSCKLQEFWTTFLQNIAGKEKSCGCISTNVIRWNTSHHVIIVDDNMFYRSMRYEYFKLARRYGLGFAEVFLECSTELALTRNGQRSTAVSADTIETMATKTESPEPDKFPWEQNNLKLDTTTSLETGSLELIKELIMYTIQNPVPPIVEDDLEEKEASRVACLESVVYQADQALRKHIGQVMAAAKAGETTKAELSSLGSQLNKKRKLFLEEIRSGKFSTTRAEEKEEQRCRNKKSEGSGCAESMDPSETTENLCIHNMKSVLQTLTHSQNARQFELRIKDIFEQYRSLNEMS